MSVKIEKDGDVLYVYPQGMSSKTSKREELNVAEVQAASINTRTNGSKSSRRTNIPHTYLGFLRVGDKFRLQGKMWSIFGQLGDIGDNDIKEFNSSTQVEVPIYEIKCNDFTFYCETWKEVEEWLTKQGYDMKRLVFVEENHWWIDLENDPVLSVIEINKRKGL